MDRVQRCHGNTSARTISHAVETFDKDAPADGSLKNAKSRCFTRSKGRTLTLYLIDEESERSVQSGAIKGTVEARPVGRTCRSQPMRRNSMSSWRKPEAAKLFKGFIVLKKAE